jgi:hypothetical protein
MTADLHPELKGIPLKHQELIIATAMGYHTCNDDTLDAFKRWRDAPENATLRDLEIEPWEPFEYHSQLDLWELVENMIYSLKTLVNAVKE